MNEREPEALFHIDWLSKSSVIGAKEAGVELLRLYEMNRELIAALEFCAGTSYITDAHEIAEAAIAKAEGDKK